METFGYNVLRNQRSGRWGFGDSRRLPADADWKSARLVEAASAHSNRGSNEERIPRDVLSYKSTCAAIRNEERMRFECSQETFWMLFPF